MLIDKAQLERGDLVEFVHENLPSQLKGKTYTVIHGPRFLTPEREYFSLLTCPYENQSVQFLNLRGRYIKTCSQCEDIAEHGGGPGYPFNTVLPKGYGIKLIAANGKTLTWV